MTDTDRMVAWLRQTLDEAQREAEEATPGPWHVSEYEAGSDYGFDAGVGTAPGEVDVVGHGYEGGGCERVQDAQHIARHNPAAVLRRITADRELLAECEAILSDPAMKDYDRDTFGGLLGYRHALAVSLAEVTIRNRAEAWGWTEGE